MRGVCGSTPVVWVVWKECVCEGGDVVMLVTWQWLAWEESIQLKVERLCNLRTRSKLVRYNP